MIWNADGGRTYFFNVDPSIHDGRGFEVPVNAGALVERPAAVSVCDMVETRC